MDEKKQGVVAAYNQLSKALLQTSAAVSDFATALAGTNDAKEALTIMANLPVLPGLSATPANKGKGADDDGPKKKEKKPKKIKDPNAPKRPPSAYIEFQNAVRTQYRETDPDMPYSEVLRKIAAVWSEMGDSDKQKWQSITAEKGKDYEIAKAKYASEHPNEYVPPEPSTSDILVSGSTSGAIGKDGKEYTGKKRGRKSAAEREALGLPPLVVVSKKEKEAAKAAAEAAAAGGTDQATLEAIAKAVEGVPKDDNAAGKKDKKKSEKKKATTPAPVVPAKEPTPSDSSSDDDDDSSEEDSSDEGSSSEESSEESADEPPPAPVVTPKANGKNKRKEVAQPVVGASSEKAKKKSKKE